ncbi:MAG: hypothetical protein N2712_02695 [Brevinematales bacterium]|nr:hypothetical protein [Brevinematales bacterium]
MRFILLVFLILKLLIFYRLDGFANLLTNVVSNSSLNVQANAEVLYPGILYSKSYDIIDISNVDLNKYVVVRSFDSIEVSSKSNVSIIFFRGGVNAVYQDKKLKCKSITVFLIDNTVREIVGEGDVRFVSGKDLFEGEKFFYDLSTGKISLYEARTKLDDQFYYADIMKQLDSNRYFFENVFFTKSDLLFPTYKVSAFRVWYYRGDYLLSVNNSYSVGVGSFLYFPTYLEFYRYTDIFTDFGVERSIGFYIQNTFYPRNWWGERFFPRLKVKFDHYEKLGEYLGFEVPSIPLLSNLNVNLIVDLEYDKKYEQKGSYIVNFIDQYGKNDYREYRTFGWYYNLKLNYSVSGTSVSFSTENLNDPFLPSKFSSRRERFDVRRFIFPNENLFWSLPGPKQSVSRNLKISYQYGISSLNLGIDWVYQLRSGYSITNTNSFGVVIVKNKTNKYENDYYRYDLQRLSGPYLYYSANLGNFISYTYEKSYTNVSLKDNVTQPRIFSKYTTNEFVIGTNYFNTNLIVVQTMYLTNFITNRVGSNTNYVISIITNISTNFFVSTNLIRFVSITDLTNNTNLGSNFVGISGTTNLVQYGYSAKFMTNISSFKWLQFSVSPSASVSVVPNSVYKVEDGTPIEDTFTHTELVNISALLGLFNNVLSISSSTGIRNNNIWTRTDNINRKKQDDLNSSATLGISSSASLSDGFFKGTFVFFEPRVSVSHNVSYRLTLPKFLSPEEDPYVDNVIAHNLSGSVYFRFLDLTVLSNSLLNFVGFSSVILSTALSYNLLYLKSEIKYKEDKSYWTNKISNPIGVNISFGPLFNYSISYRVKLSNDIVVFDPVGVGMSGGLSVRDLSLLYLIKKVNFININYQLFFDYVNPINNRFSLSFSIGGNIDENWSFALSTSIVNNKIFRYVPEYALRYNVPQVNIIQDIVDAINIFDINALRRTLFKNTGVTISILRDLYDWIASLSGGIRLYKDEVRNFAFFEPYVSFEVKSKKSIGIDVPPIQPELYRLFE